MSVELASSHLEHVGWRHWRKEGWEKFTNEEFSNLYPFRYSTRVMKWRKTWSGLTKAWAVWNIDTGLLIGRREENISYSHSCDLYCLRRSGPRRVMVFSFLRFLDHAQRRTTDTSGRVSGRRPSH